MPPLKTHSMPSAPSDWIARFAPFLPKGATVLDVACGGGRHVRYLLDRGCRVTCVDRDVTALADVSDKAEVIPADLEDGSPWPLGQRAFDCVLVTNYLHRPLFPALLASVAENGCLLYETFALGNERYGRPRNPDHLLRPNELLDLAGDSLMIAAFEQGILHRCGEPRVVQRLYARKYPEPVELP